jgi:alpha-aminoadipate/glutamate carrier protein LysW
MPTSVCPECSEEVFVEAEIEQGDNVICEECHAKLVVVGLDPIELDLHDDADDEKMSDKDDFEGYGFDDDRY